MVTIVDYKTYEKEDGTTFNTLIVQGGIEAVKNKETGRTYLTTRTARVSCTFDELTCEALKGTQLPGSVKKVNSEPYEYTIPNTGEVVTLTHRFEFISEEESILKENVILKEEVI
ncbi:hypothetical protein SAMN06265371_108214 [Lutibacter agarilyticus]|uniref:Uncharacterized protein n=1 Tax=Lutibacter agarilyticus TaxID=1109740 RepID=A0A238YD14_9FLAO|nr:hypothetical protein [Lutibacter agarilyticus]SNR68621.1 hypothetical protein SAMN06265371_108214 [Lutibacter agarilyticus]